MTPKLLFRFALLVCVGAFLCAVQLTAFPRSAQEHSTQEAPSPKPDETWFCPMHPDVTSPSAGTCSKCSMSLIPGNPFDTRDYQLDLATSPAAVRAGLPFQLTLSVRHPGTGAIVRDFEVVHDKRYHLFVISEDMTSFQHVHPTEQPDGTWTLDVTVPKPGYYRILSDFVPSGGGPQFLSHSLVTTDFNGDAESQGAHLTPDAILSRTSGSITADVRLQPEPLVAGEYGHMSFVIRDSITGEPVTDLQPYLGAFGHMLMMSEDMADYVHAHPTARPELDVRRGLAGPDVQFEGYMPRPGLYRAWAQFQRRGTEITVPFTFKVWSLEERSHADRARHLTP